MIKNKIDGLIQSGKFYAGSAIANGGVGLANLGLILREDTGIGQTLANASPAIDKAVTAYTLIITPIAMALATNKNLRTRVCDKSKELQDNMNQYFSKKFAQAKSYLAKKIATHH